MKRSLFSVGILPAIFLSMFKKLSSCFTNYKHDSVIINVVAKSLWNSENNKRASMNRRVNFMKKLSWNAVNMSLCWTLMIDVLDTSCLIEGYFGALWDEGALRAGHPLHRTGILRESVLFVFDFQKGISVKLSVMQQTPFGYKWGTIKISQDL